ncbi:MAG: PAS domain S-box protein [Chthoniobacterales bacterium]
MTDDSLMLDERSFQRRLRRATVALSLALGLPLIALLVLVVVLLQSAGRVEHSTQVIARTNALKSKLLFLQTSFRGFRLSGDESYLRMFEEERHDLDASFATLKKLVSDNPRQTSQVGFLRRETEVWLLFVDGELRRVRGQPPLIRDPTFLPRGSALFAVTQNRIDKFSDEEFRLRMARHRSLHRAVVLFLSTLGIVAIFGIPLLIRSLQRLLRRVSGAYRASLSAAEVRTAELRVTLASIGDAVVATDGAGMVSFLNPAAESLMGWTNAEAGGRSLTEVFPIFDERTRNPVANPVERVLRENRVLGLANHTILRTRDGREVPIEDSAAPIRDDDGQVRSVILVFHDVTERRRTEQNVLASEARFRFLDQLGEETLTLAHPGEIMATTTRLLGQHLRVSRCAYAEVNSDGNQFTILHDYTDQCASTAGQYELSLFGPRATGQMRGGETLVLHDVEVELATEEGGGMFNAIGIRAIVCCPLLKGEALRAMMAVHQTTARAWTSSEIALLREVAERCWATIERARAEEETQTRARLASLRADVAAQLDLGQDLDRTLQRCCDLLVDDIDLVSAQIWLPDRSGTQLRLRVSSGLAGALPDLKEVVSLGEGVVGRIAQSQEREWTNNVASDPRWSAAEFFPHNEPTAFAGYPLLVEKHLLGVLTLVVGRPFLEATLAEVKLIADLMAQHLDRKRAESALQTSENLKTAILDTSLDGSILMDHEGRVVDWNFAAENIFGYRRAEAVGQLLGDLIVPEALRESHRQGLARYVATRQAKILGRRYELPALRKDKTEFSCEISITHIPATEPPIFAGYARDLSERKKTEAALQDAIRHAEDSARAVKESAERYRLLSEVVSIQVWTARPDGGLDYANAECLEYFGVTVSEDVLGSAWTNFVHPDDLPRAAGAWQKALASGAHYEVEFRLRAAGGNYRWFLVRAEAMRDDAGRIAKWLGTNTDINDLKAAQAKAERASSAKDNFLAVLSHELRTPLTPVLMTASALYQDDRLPADVRAQLGMMERNIALEARLIDDLLDLTRITRGKLPLRPQLCDAHSLIGLAVEIVRDEALVKGIAIEQDFEAQRSGLMADPSRFQQVIWNLLRNAVKFTPAGGSVSIRTHDVAGEDGDEPRLSIEVSDTGVGIDAQALERIFQPFEQADLTGERRFGGVGLGLSIARAIVDLHGGTIRAESSGKGEGSLFVVELPGARRPPSGAAELPNDADVRLPGGSTAEKSGPPVRSLRLLVVEDHEATLQVLTRLLTHAGHQVVAASSIAAALNAAGQGKFDLVMSDLGLPDGTGNELMEQLRDRYQLRGIALTGYGMEEDLERSRQSGFVSHLIKPVDINQLRRTLDSFATNPEEESA